MVPTASNAALWSACPASTILSGKRHSEATDPAKARDGVLAHETFIAVYTGKDVPEGATPEMIRCAVESVEALGIPDLHIGGAFTAPFGMSGSPDLWGEGVVVEYKYGHTPVTPKFNMQLAAYDLLTGAQRRSVVYVVIQPRRYDGLPIVDRWLPSQDARDAMHAALQVSYESATSSAPTVRTGEHCGRCPALAVCPFAMEASVNAVDVCDNTSLVDLTEDVRLLSNGLRILRGAHKTLSAKLAALESEAVARIESGQTVPGYTLQTRAIARKWKKDVDVIGLGLLYGLSLSDDKPVTVAEAERRGLPAHAIEGLTEGGRSAPKLTEYDTEVWK